jgi:hypothetical protein
MSSVTYADLTRQDILRGKIYDTYPNVDWNLFRLIDHMLLMELLDGPVFEYGEHYDTYVWHGFVNACNDLRGLLDDVSCDLFVDNDTDEVFGSCPDESGSVTILNVYETLMSRHTYRQIFG